MSERRGQHISVADFFGIGRVARLQLQNGSAVLKRRVCTSCEHVILGLVWWLGYMPKGATKARRASALVVWGVQSQDLLLEPGQFFNKSSLAACQAIPRGLSLGYPFFLVLASTVSAGSCRSSECGGAGIDHVPFPLFGFGTRNCSVACKFPHGVARRSLQLLALMRL